MQILIGGAGAADFPLDGCGLPKHAFPFRLLYAPQGQHGSIYEPAIMHNGAQVTPSHFLWRLRRAARSMRGFYVAERPSSALPTSVGDPPLADSHGGTHDVFRPWPVQGQGGNDRGSWTISWSRDPRNASGHPQVIPESPPIWAAVLPNAWISSGHVHTCEVAAGAGGCRAAMFPFRAKRALGKALAVCDGWCFGYFHFTHEHLPRVAMVYDTLVRDPSVRIVVPTAASGYVPYVEEYMVDVFGFKRSRLTSDAPAFCRWVLYPQPQSCGNTFSSALLVLREVVFRRLRLPHAVPAAAERRRRGGLTVVLAERHDRSRTPRNWDEATRALRERCARCTFASSGGLPVAAQVRLFNAADIAFGPHGANLANVIWMRHGTTAVELQAYNYGNMCYYTSAQRLGILWRFVLFSGSKEGGNYTVAPEELARHLEDARRRAYGEPPLVWA